MGTIAELFTVFGFKVDDSQLKKLDASLNATAARVQKLGGALDDAFQDKAGRWHAANGRFLSMGEKAAMGIANGFKGALGSGAAGSTFQEALNNLGEKASSGFASMRRVGFGVAALFTGEAFGVGAILRTAGEFEQIQVAFETMIGDSDRAKKALGDLQQFAMKTPFNFKELATGSKQLLAFGYQAEELVPTLETLGNIAAGVGRDKLPHLIMALGQARAAGHLQGHILREFTMAGVPLGAELAKARGVAPAAIEGQRIPFAEVERALYNLSHGTGRFTGLLEKQSRTLLGMVTNVVDYLQLLAKRLGDRGLLAQAKGYIAQFQNFLQTHDAEILNVLDRVAQACVKGMNAAIRLAIGINGIVHAMGGWDTVITAVSYALTILMGLKILSFVGEMTQALFIAAKAFAVFGEAGLLASAEIVAIGAAIVGLILIIEDVVSYFQGKKSVTGYILGSIAENGGGFSKWISSVFGDVEGAIDSAIKPMLGKLQNVGKVIALGIVEGIKNLPNLGEIILGALEVVLKAGDAILEIGAAIADGIIQGLIAGLKANFPTLASALGINSADDSTPLQTTFEAIRNARSAVVNKARSFADSAGQYMFDHAPQEWINAAAGFNTNAAVAGGARTQISTGDIHVHVPPGTSHDGLPSAVARGVADGLITAQTLRETKAAVSGRDK